MLATTRARASAVVLIRPAIGRSACADRIDVAVSRGAHTAPLSGLIALTARWRAPGFLPSHAATSAATCCSRSTEVGGPSHGTAVAGRATRSSAAPPIATVISAPSTRAATASNEPRNERWRLSKGTDRRMTTPPANGMAPTAARRRAEPMRQSEALARSTISPHPRTSAPAFPSSMRSNDDQEDRRRRKDLRF